VKSWSVVDKALVGVLLVVVAVAATFGVLALRGGGDDRCQEGTLESDLEVDIGPVEVFQAYIQSRPDDYPVDDSWILESDDDGEYVFVSDNGGRFEVAVRAGLVRRYLSCPDE
jgi:hypothetical protein